MNYKWSRWRNWEEIWQYSEKWNETQIMIFLPQYMWAENNKEWNSSRWSDFRRYSQKSDFEVVTLDVFIS